MAESVDGSLYLLAYFVILYRKRRSLKNVKQLNEKTFNRQT